MKRFAPQCLSFIVFAEIYSTLSYRLKESYNARKKPDETDEIFINGQFIDKDSPTIAKLTFVRSPELFYAEFLENLIFSARKSVHVMMYIFTSNILAEALKNVHERGIHVLVMVDSSMEHSSNSRYQYLKGAGVQCRIVKDKTLHLKMCLIDVTYDDEHFVPNRQIKNLPRKNIEFPQSGCVVSGSMNWTREALISNHDTFTLYRSPNVVKSSAKAFYNIWNSTLP